MLFAFTTSERLVGASMAESQFPALNKTGSNFDESSNDGLD